MTFRSTEQETALRKQSTDLVATYLAQVLVKWHRVLDDFEG